MSTKTILELIQATRKNGSDEDAKTAVRALGELTAIHRVAKLAVANGVTHRLAASDDGLELALLLEAVAGEVPW